MSFSGIGTTTGFHPLWAYILGGTIRLLSMSGLDAIRGPLIAMIGLSTIAAVVFVIANYRTIYKLSQDRWHSALVTLIFFGFTWRFLYDGMESGLVLALLSLSFWAAVSRRFLALGLFVFLMPWARIDAAIFSLVFSLMAFVGWSAGRVRAPEARASLGGARIWLFAVPLILGLAALSAGLRLIIFGSQVSESVKFYWFSLRIMNLAETFSSPIRYLAGTALNTIGGLSTIFDPLATAFDPALVFNSNSRPADNQIQQLMLAVAILGVCGLVFVRLRAAGNQPIRRNYVLLSATALLSACLYLFVVKFFGFWQPYWEWYLAAPVYVLLIAVVLFWYGLHSGDVFVKARPLMWGLSWALLAGLVIGNIRFVHGTLDPKPEEWRWVYNEMVLAIDALPVEADESVGTWAAGHIGYFSRHRVVNLEGLIEAPEVLEASITDDIRPILSSHGIKYIAIKATPDAIRLTVKQVAYGLPKWQMSIRKRVFKDLVWEPIVVSDDPRLRSPYSIHRIAPRPEAPGTLGETEDPGQSAKPVNTLEQ
jgi:hypothetical protein